MTAGALTGRGMSAGPTSVRARAHVMARLEPQAGGGHNLNLSHFTLRARLH